MTSHSIRKRSKLLIGGGLLAAMLAVTPGIAGLDSAAWAAPEPLEYVALGDSYAAGLGLQTSTGTPAECGRTTSSYPQQVAAALGLSLTDVTCSGATTLNITTNAQTVGTATNPVQALALSPSTDIVTLTIGGNDLGFTSIILACLAPSATAPSCTANPLVSDLPAKITSTVAPAINTTLAEIKAAAPNAEIFVVAYPALMPDLPNTPITGCYGPSFPFTNADVMYLNGVQTQLDAAIAAAATTAGATFVPMFSSTLGNTPCAGNTNSFLNGFSLSPGAMHPNAIGADFMAETVKAALLADFTTPVISPASNDYSVPANVFASLNFEATGFPEPSLDIFGTLPAGMSFADGVVSGTPTTPGHSTFSLTASSAGGTVTENYSISVTEIPSITSSTPPSTGTVGVPYSFTVTASGFPAPTFAVTSDSLPAGLTLDPVSGVVSGTLSAPDNFTFAITATNTEGSATSESYSIRVDQANVAPVITSAAPTSPGVVGTPYSFTITATGFPAPTFAIPSGSLPKGLSLDAASGVIHGTPTEVGKFAFSITASNATDPDSTVQYAIAVTDPAAVTPGAPKPPVLVETGSARLVPAGIAGGIALLSGAVLLAARRKLKH